MTIDDENETNAKFELNRVNGFESSAPEPEQSANSLFHFVKTYEYLETIIKNKKLPLWYVEENIEYLSIDNIQSIYIPMKCFCDINFHKIKTHMNYYGEYGIGFSKLWGIKHGIQPVQYINQYSYLATQYKESYSAAIVDSNSINDEIANYLSAHIMYMKPLVGEQNDVLGETHHKYFSDESEWRFVFDTSNLSGCKQFYLGNEFTSVESLNNIIFEKYSEGISFDYSDVKYLIVKTNDDFDKIISLLNKRLSDERELSKLISKIIVWDESRSDF